MMKLNEEHLRKPYPGTVITFSHFLPRQGLPYILTEGKSVIKCIGCEAIDDQLREVKSKLHVYGNTRKKYSNVFNGVRYVHQPLGYEFEREEDVDPPFLMVYNGRSVCIQEWGIDGLAPMGYVKRLVHLVFYVMPGMDPQKQKAAFNVVTKFNRLPGIRANFTHLGSAKETFRKELWPELGQLTCGATHVLLVIADDACSLQKLLQDKTYSTEFCSLVNPLAQNSVTLNTRLGIDLQHEKKEDPLLVFYVLRLKDTLTDDSEDYSKIGASVVRLANLQGAKGKIDLCFHRTGHMHMSQQRLLDEMGGIEDKSKGMTHVLTMFADAPASFKLVAKSKTFEKWKTAFETYLDTAQDAIPLMAFAIPLETQIEAAAPREVQIRNRRGVKNPTRPSR